MDSTKGGPDSSFNDSLIREVRRHSIIYDTTHPLYGNALKKQETWNEVAAVLGEKVEAIKTRWRTLRDRYTKERRRITLSGGGSSFSYYADLNFLDLYMTEGRRNLASSAVLNVKQDGFDQASEVGDDFDLHHGETNRVGAEEMAHIDDTETSDSTSDQRSPHRDLCSTSATAVERSMEEVAVPRKRIKMEPEGPSPESVAEALLKSADALQRLADRKTFSQRLNMPPKDADECFADFVCMSLKAIDNESRVHARIAILHALAQFQT